MGALRSTTTCMTAAAVTLLLAGAASASTLTFDGNPQDGFSVSPLSTNESENCPTQDDRCMLVNNRSGDSVLTYSGGAFDLAGFRFILNHGPVANTLNLTAQFMDGTTATHLLNLASGFSRNTTYDLSLALTNLASLTFSHSGGGSARVDDINVSPAAVPLPAAGLLFASALVGLGAFGRRRKAL